MTWFAIGTYRSASTTRLALAVRGGAYDLGEAAIAAGHAAQSVAWTGGNLDEVIAQWDNRLGLIRSVALTLQSPPPALKSPPDIAARLQAPLRPVRIFCAASNYIEHANEMGTVLAAKSTSKPYVFMKTGTTVIGPGDTVRLPPESAKVDWEVELAAIIGRGGRHIPLRMALEHVAAYTVVNDVSARDLTRREDYPFKFDWFQGKNFDTFCPMGPWIVPAECVGDPQRLKLSLAVNDTMMQEATTAEMIWTLAEQIAYLSSMLTLRPGDVIATGTPTGVGAGRGIFLKAGDIMTASIEHIGTLINPVAAEEPR